MRVSADLSTQRRKGLNKRPKQPDLCNFYSSLRDAHVVTCCGTWTLYLESILVDDIATR